MLLEYVNWEDAVDDEAAAEEDDIGRPEIPAISLRIPTTARQAGWQAGTRRRVRRSKGRAG